MAEATQDVQLTLRGIDQASPQIREVQAALERLGQLNLSGTTGQLDALSRGLDTLGSQAQLLGERFNAMSAVVRAAMSTMTADVTAQAAQQRAALQQHGEETLAAVRDTQTAMTGVIAQAVKDQAAALGKGLEGQKGELDAGTQQLVKIVRDAYAQIDAVVDTSWKSYVQKAQDAMAQANATVQQGVQKQAAALGAAGSGTAGTGRTAEQSTLASRLLSEKGPVGGPMDVPGLDLAQQFVIWGSVFSLYSQATQAVSTLSKELFTSNASFEEVGATLSAIYGGSGPAQQALAWLDNFAETTPFTRDQVRQAGIAFAAQGDDITKALTAAGNLSSAMHNVGGIQVSTQAIVDAQNNQFRLLRDSLHVTIPELEKFGLVAEKNGHVISQTVLPAIEAFVQHNFSGAMDAQLKTLPGMFSNLQDIVTEGLRHAGAGAYDAVKSWFTPLMASISDTVTKGLPGGAGLASDTGGLITFFSDTIGKGLGQIAASGLSDLDAWVAKMGGATGVITTLQRAWIEFTSALRVGFSIVQGVGDALGNVFGLLRTLADGVGRLLGPIQAVFGLFGAGGDGVRTLTATIVTLGLELRVLATVYDLASTTLARFTGVLAANTAAQEANAAASGTAAAAQGAAAAAGGLQMGAALRNMTIGLPGVVMGAAGRVGGAVAGAAGPVGAGTMALSLFGDTSLLIGTIAGRFTALSEAIVGAIGPLGVFLADLYLLPKAFSDITLFIQTLRGIDVKGLQTDLGLGIPKTTYAVPPTPGPPLPEVDIRTPFGVTLSLGGGRGPATGGVQATGPGAFASFLQNTYGNEAYRDWTEFIGHQRPGDFISYVQRMPENARDIVAAEYGREGGTGGAQRIEQLALGTAAGLTPEQQANVYTAFNQALVRTAQDAASRIGRQNLQGDVNAQIETYAARYRALHPGATAQQVGAATDQYGIPLYQQYGLPAPPQIGTPRGAAQGVSQDTLNALAQAAQQAVQWDEAAKVPYAQFKHDMDAATKAMQAAGDPAIQVQAFYRQHTDAWARAAAQVSQQTLQADEAMHAPFSVIQRDMADLATKLKAEGDTSQQIAAKLGQTVETYFQNLISQVSAQQQALATLHAPVGQQLAGVAQQQAYMAQENAQLAKQGLPPKYTAEEIAAAGVTGTRQVLGPGLQAQATVSKDAYSAALQQNQVTSLGQIAGYVGPILAAERAQLTNQGTPGAQITAELQLEQLQLIRQGQDAVLKRAQDQFTFDLNAHASVKQLHQDENAALAVIAAESGPGSIQYKLAKQQMDQQIAGGAGAGAARPPEPHYGTYGGLTATGAAYGQVVASFGTQLAHDPWQAVVAGLREQLMFWKSRAQHDERLLAASQKTAENTGQTASAVNKLLLPPFPTAPVSQAALPRVSGGHTPIRRP